MSALRSITCLMALAATAAAQSQAAQNKEIVQNARTLLQQRAEAWQVITKERADWKLGREILTDRIGMAKRETEGLRGKTAEADQNITEADRKTEELVTVNEALKQAAVIVGDHAEMIGVDLLAREKELERRHREKD